MMDLAAIDIGDGGEADVWVRRTSPAELAMTSNGPN